MFAVGDGVGNEGLFPGEPGVAVFFIDIHGSSHNYQPINCRQGGKAVIDIEASAGRDYSRYFWPRLANFWPNLQREHVPMNVIAYLP